MSKSINRLLIYLVMISLTGTLACQTGVKYYEKEHFSDSIMGFESDSTSTHFDQKCRYSREGSVGGIGNSAGGGCGCY